MTDPAIALVLAIAGLAGLVVLFWPDRGLYWRVARTVRATERVLIEDALKHLFDCEYQGRDCTLQSIAGALRVSTRRAAELLERMETQELVTSGDGVLRLTDEGRSYALRVIRIHRLWERYLSEETGYGPAQWHSHAEELEHLTSAEEAEAMATRMGDPRFDPHGDPIPTAGGEITPRRGRALTDLAVGDSAEVVHVEDEPKEIYAQLVAAGLHPGVRLRVLESTARRIRFETDDDEQVLAPLLAANVAVQPIERLEPQPSTASRLSTLELGEEAVVTGFSPLCRGPERRRLLDLGLIPGTIVRAELASPGGDPVGYRIRGAVIALRKHQADQIVIDREPARMAS